MVGSYFSTNLPWMKRRVMALLPTEPAPNTTIFSVIIILLLFGVLFVFMPGMYFPAKSQAININ